MILISIYEYDLKIFSMNFTKVIVMMMMMNKMMTMVMVTIIVMTKMILSSQVANLKRGSWHHDHHNHQDHHDVQARYVAVSGGFLA